MNTPRKVPVTILTGFLGSGKTRSCPAFSAHPTQPDLE